MIFIIITKTRDGATLKGRYRVRRPSMAPAIAKATHAMAEGVRVSEVSIRSVRLA